MSRRFWLLISALMLWLSFSGIGFAQQTSRAPAIMVDTPTATITTGTVDTTATPSTGAHSAIVQFKFGTVVGTYTTCTVQAKTTINGSDYLNLSTTASILVTTGTTNTWTVTAKGPSSGNTSSPSTTTADGFGQLTKYTFACSGAYGTSAPVTISTIYSPDVIGGAAGGGGGGGAVTAGNGDIVPLGSTTDARCTATDGTAEGLICLLKQVVFQLGNALTITDGSGAVNVIVDSSAAITANAGANLNTSALALEAGNLASLLTSLGATSDALVAAGATGSVEAKLRRLTQGLEDLKSLIVLAAGNNNIGDVDVATVPADPFGANADAAATQGSTGSISAKLRTITSQLNTLNSAINPVSLSCAITSTASTNSTSCKGSAGNRMGGWVINTTATLYYLRFYNTATAPTCSSATGFIISMPIPAATTGAGITYVIPAGVAFATGYGYCITASSTSTANDNAAAGIYGELYYN